MNWDAYPRWGWNILGWTMACALLAATTEAYGFFLVACLGGWIYQAVLLALEIGGRYE